MGTKLTYESVKSYIESFGYKLLSEEYVNSSVKLTVECNIGHEYNVSWGKFQSGRRCPYCSNRVKTTKEEVISNLQSEGYKLKSEEYVNSNIPILIECSNGHEWKVTYQKFKQGRRCPRCTGRYREYTGHIKWNIDLVKAEIEKNNYQMISTEYKNSDSRIEMICDKGHEIEIRWGHFARGVRCKQCRSEEHAYFQKHTDDEVDQILGDIGYKRLSEYKNNHSKLKVKCNNGHESEMLLSNIKSGVRCKYCRYSKGEKKIIDYLDEQHINYDREYRVFNEELDTHMVFDFVIFNKDGESTRYIEYDGIQHFEERDFFRESLQTIQQRDRIKDNYCSSMNIPLLRIPYTKYNNVEEELNKFIYK